MRLLFIKVMERIFHDFSRQYFKEHFFEECISVYKDPVSNIRLKFAAIITHIRSTLVLPADIAQLQKFNEVLATMMSKDPKKDVIKAVKVAFNILHAPAKPEDPEILKEDQRKQQEESELAAHSGNILLEKRNLGAINLAKMGIQSKVKPELTKKLGAKIVPAASSAIKKKDAVVSSVPPKRISSASKPSVVPKAAAETAAPNPTKTSTSSKPVTAPKIPAAAAPAPAKKAPTASTTAAPKAAPPKSASSAKK
jgi:hypothetical protein